MAIFINSILLDDNNGDWLYEGSDNNVYFSQSNQLVGDIMSWSRPVQNFNPTDFGWDDVTAARWIDGGKELYFAKDSRYYRQYFEEIEIDYVQTYQPLNSLVDITDNLYSIEDNKQIDIDQDGYKGTPPAYVEKTDI